jgi:hypothetical protein
MEMQCSCGAPASGVIYDVASSWPVGAPPRIIGCYCWRHPPYKMTATMTVMEIRHNTRVVMQSGACSRCGNAITAEEVPYTDESGECYACYTRGQE